MKPAWGHGVWCVVASLLLFVPNVAAVVVPFEAWPYTCAPMFAASPVDNALYLPTFILEKKDGSTEPLPTLPASGISEWLFKRAFLIEAWGSDDPSTSFGHVDDDTAAKRAARIERFVQAMIRHTRRSKRPVFDDVVALRIDLEQTQPVKSKRVLGRYVVAAHHFETRQRLEHQHSIAEVP